VAHVRRSPDDGSISVGEALERERSFLLPLPANRFETEHVRVVSSGKTPYVRFDRNLYSIPSELVRKTLTLTASESWVRVLDGQREVARHARSWGAGDVVEDPSHVEELVRRKQSARDLKGRDRLLAAVPETERVFTVLAIRGDNLGATTSRLLSLLDDYGAEELRAAVVEAIGREAFGAGSVAHVLEQRRRARGLVPPVRVQLPDDPRVRDLRVTPHRLEDYDALGKHRDERKDKNPRG
jgi:hypothetical protein